MSESKSLAETYADFYKELQDQGFSPDDAIWFTRRAFEVEAGGTDTILGAPRMGGL
ncbi:hypothetical protein DFO66_103379 [Brevibacterium sanguinis]|uniref:Uncharacterized protein n=2 Tax=Brevibacterium TaxID=1696 RepID=A0A366IMI6_9MICO|nr:MULTISPECIES: hypothetical protein [Brevibacterium]RBP66429.1 hypothetical protein DFO66_103379 [Brevibacterium sanguinis]RBP73081.1 hypothetical protein DFO65_103379 [Brevibacterium celere]